MAVDTAQRLARIQEQLAQPWADDEERTLDTGGVPIHMRKRGDRYDLDDRGTSVAEARAAGAPRDWLRIAEDVVAQEGFNVNRRGVVFVQVRQGRDLASIALRLADCADAVRAALLDDAT